MTESERRISDEELEGVLSRAADLDRTDEGWRADQIEEIASEAGISSAAVRQAISEISAGGTRSTISDLKLTRHRETAFAPVALGDEELAFLVRLLDRLGHIGAKIRYHEGQVVWITGDRVHVRLTRRQAETHVTAEGDLMGVLARGAALFVASGVTWMIALWPIFGGDLTPDSLGAQILIGLALGAVGFAGFWAYQLRRLRKRVAELAAALAETVGLVGASPDE